VRKYHGKLIIKPSKSSVKTLLADIRTTIKSNNAAKTENLIHVLNNKLRGWSNYHRHICAKKTFEYIDHCIFKALWRWTTRRHPNKGRRWIKRKYFRTTSSRNWIFSTKIRKRDGETVNLDLFDIGQVKIKRHVKIKANATPYDPQFAEYFQQRKEDKAAEFNALREIAG
jgi:RNA-directed DNA polymerase